MIDSLFNTSTMPLLARVASFTERRQEVLAGNIANVSTPGYRTHDLPVAEFQSALREAIDIHRTPDRAGEGNWSYIPVTRGDPEAVNSRELFAALESGAHELTFRDGNNRNIEQEVMEMNKNSLLQNVAIDLLTVQFNRLQAVISERA